MYFFQIFLGTFLLSVLIGVGYAFYDSHHFNAKKKQEFVQKYLKSVQEIFDLQTLEVSGIAELKYSEKDKHFFSSLTNPLFAKEYEIVVPFQATYGISLKNVNVFNFFQSKIYVDLPKPELISFDLQLYQKKIISKEGWLIFQKDDKFMELEKKIYEKQKTELLNNKTLKARCYEEAKNTIQVILQPLNLPVEFDKIPMKR